MVRKSSTAAEVAAKYSLALLKNKDSIPTAVGIPNVLVWTYYFWKKDVDAGYILKNPEYYAKQAFQKIIYRLNQPFMRKKILRLHAVMHVANVVNCWKTLNG